MKKNKNNMNCGLKYIKHILMQHLEATRITTVTENCDNHKIRSI